MKILKARAVFFTALFLFLGTVYWLPSELDFDSKNNRTLQLQVLGNYTLLASLIIPFYLLVFKYKEIKTIRQNVNIHLILCPVYVILWYTLGSKLYHRLGGIYVYGNRFAEDFYRNNLYCDVYTPLLVYILFFLCFHIYHYYLQLNDLKKRENQLLAITYRNEINALKASIQPMFLSRSLNAIHSAVPDQYVHAKTLIDKLINIIQYSLNIADKQNITVGEEIEFVKSYLALEQERFRHKIDVVYNISADSLQVKIPPMLIQPIVENSVKHGIEKNVGGGTIEVSVIFKDAYLSICISDTGKGVANLADPELFTKGIGLGNTKRRIKQLFNEDIQVTASYPSGLKVSYKIPCD